MTATKRQGLREVLTAMGSVGGVVRVTREVEPTIEIPSVMRGLAKLDPIPTLLFENIKGFPGVKGCAALFSDKPRMLRALGLPVPQVELNETLLQALDRPLPPMHVDQAPCKENIQRGSIDVSKLIFATRGASQSNHLYYQPIIFTRHPKTGKINVGQYRVSLQEPGRVTINLRVTQHGGLQLQAAKEMGVPLQVAVCIGVPPALYVAASSQQTYGYEEVGFAGALIGEPIEMVRAETVDLDVPAYAEVVIEGEIRPPYELGSEGPWPEYLGYLGMNIHPPLMDITAVTFRNNPINVVFTPGAIPEPVPLASEAQLLRHLRALGGEFVVDVALTPGARRHHAVVKVKKIHPHHEGFQINIALEAFGLGSASALDTVTLVDQDIDIRDYRQIDWAVATRCNPARQVHILPEARCHQNNPIAGVRELLNEPVVKAKMIIDATIPWNYRMAEVKPGITFFTKSVWPDVDIRDYLSAEDRKKWAD